MKKTLCLALVLLSITTSKGFSQIWNDRLSLSQLVHAIRDPQTDSMHFRASLEKIGEYLALEVLQDLNRREVEIETLTGGVAAHHLCDEKPALITILRGGVPLLTGVQQIFPDSEVGFLGMARNEETLKATTSYIALPNVENRTVIITDTMVATAGSALDAIKIVEKYHPKEIIFVCAIAARGGIARIAEYNPAIKVYAAAIDPLLNEKGYIVPGLGDAGDRSYGEKITLHGGAGG